MATTHESEALSSLLRDFEESAQMHRTWAAVDKDQGLERTEAWCRGRAEAYDDAAKLVRAQMTILAARTAPRSEPSRRWKMIRTGSTDGIMVETHGDLS